MCDSIDSIRTYVAGTKWVVSHPSASSPWHIKVQGGNVVVTLTTPYPVNVNNSRVTVSRSKGTLQLVISRDNYTMSSWPHTRITLCDGPTHRIALPTKMLYPMIGSMMSLEERKYRDVTVPPVIFALKDSIHSIFLRAEEMAKKGQHSLFASIAVAAANPKAAPDGRLIIWLDNVRWMEEQNNVVFDVAYCLLKHEFVRDVAGWMMDVKGENLLTVVLQEYEFQLWCDHYLPLMASRVAAAYSPLPLSSSASTSLDNNGVPLPARFLALPGANRVAKYFTRAAIFPIFPPQGVNATTGGSTGAFANAMEEMTVHIYRAL